MCAYTRRRVPRGSFFFFYLFIFFKRNHISLRPSRNPPSLRALLRVYDSARAHRNTRNYYYYHSDTPRTSIVSRRTKKKKNSHIIKIHTPCSPRIILLSLNVHLRTHTHTHLQNAQLESMYFTTLTRGVKRMEIKHRK